MADLRATSIRLTGDGKTDRLTLPKKTASDEITKGDFLIWAATGVEKMDAATEDATFVGVAGSDSLNADGPSEILVLQDCIVQVPVESDTYTVGQGLRYNTNGTLMDDQDTTPANTIAWSIEHHGAAVTSLKVRVNVMALAKLFSIEA